MRPKTPSLGTSCVLHRPVCALLALCAQCTLPLLAGEITLAWDPNSEPDLAGYRLYVGTASGQYSQTLDVGNVTTKTLTGLAADTNYYAAVTAYNTFDLESDYSSEISFTIPSAPPPNEPPSLALPGSQSHAEAEAVVLAIGAADPDGDPLTFSASGLPDGLAIDPGSGVISGTLTYQSAGVYSVTVSVSDGTEATSGGFSWTVTGVNRPPLVTGPGDQMSSIGDGISLVVDATDPDGDALTFLAAGLPDGLTIDSGAGLIGGTISDDAAGTHAVTVTVSDGGDQASANFAWTVRDPNEAPVLAAPSDQSHSEDNEVSLQIEATDPDDDPLAFSASGLPDGLVLDPATGVIAGTLSYQSAGTYSPLVTVSDGTATATAGFLWIVTNVNRDPALTNPGDQTSTVNSSVSLPLIASDPDNDPLAFSAAGLPDGLVFDSASGLISGVPTQAGSYVVTVSATDGYGGSDALSFLWSVSDSRIALVSLVIEGAGTELPITVPFGRDLRSPVVVVTLNYDLDSPPLVARVSNVQTDRFDLKLARVDGLAGPVNGVTAHVLAAEEGVYTIKEHGVKMEAVTFTSTVTDSAPSNWAGERRFYQNSYNSPVVLGQVMSSNDPAWSQFWASDGTRNGAPSPTALSVGKHVGEDPDASRLPETIGYLVIEAGSGTLAGLDYEAGRATNLAKGAKSATHTYPLKSDLPTAQGAALSVAGMDSNNGVWPILLGDQAVNRSALSFFLDEDRLQDSERKDNTKQVAYAVFGTPDPLGQLALAPQKTALKGSFALSDKPTSLKVIFPSESTALNPDQFALVYHGAQSLLDQPHRILRSEDLIDWVDVTAQFQRLDPAQAMTAYSPTASAVWIAPRNRAPRAFFKIVPADSLTK